MKKRLTAQENATAWETASKLANEAKLVANSTKDANGVAVLRAARLQMLASPADVSATSIITSTVEKAVAGMTPELRTATIKAVIGLLR